MPRQKSSDQLEALRRQQIEIAKRLKEAEAKHRQKEKADDERRCHIVGALALDHMDAEPKSPCSETIRALISANVRSAADRALFNLPPLPRPEPEAAVAEEGKKRHAKSA
jgi:hypothetical protein